MACKKSWVRIPLAPLTYLFATKKFARNHSCVIYLVISAAYRGGPSTGSTKWNGLLHGVTIRGNMGLWVMFFPMMYDCADERNGDESKQTHVQDHRSLVACSLLLRAGCSLFSGRRGGTGQEDARRDPGKSGRRHELP